jgi:bacterioferritin-associated ferredoxin
MVLLPDLHKDRQPRPPEGMAAPDPPYVCACMRLTHADLIEAVAAGTIQTLADLRRQTGAGDGCMACHRRLACYLSPAPHEPGVRVQPICSVR